MQHSHSSPFQSLLNSSGRLPGGVSNVHDIERRRGERRSGWDATARQGLSDDDIREILRIIRDQQQRDFELAKQARESLEERLREERQVFDARLKAVERWVGRTMTFAGAIVILAMLLQWAGPTRVFRWLGQLAGGP